MPKIQILEIQILCQRCLIQYSQGKVVKNFTSLLPCSHHKYKVKRFDNLLRKKKSASKAFMFFSNTKFSVMMFNT